MTKNSIKKNEGLQPESHFRPQDAARHLLTNIPTAKIDETVGAVRGRITKKARQWDTINYVYVLNKTNKLVGVASIREIFQTNQGKKMSVYAKKDLAVVYPHSHIRIAAARALKHNIKSVPVVDKNGRLLGLIGSDLILNTLETEHVRDLLSAVGLPTRKSFTDVFSNKLTNLIEWRTPWLVVGLFGGMVATTLVESFSKEIEEVVALAFFIPVMVYMGAAVGTQAQMLFVRGLSYQHIKIRLYIFRELIIDVVIGIIVALLLLAFTLVLTKSVILGVIVSLSVFVIMSTAGLVAISMSLLLIKFKRDPAVGGGPFTTIVQDLLSLLLYFAIATFLLR